MFYTSLNSPMYVFTNIILSPSDEVYKKITGEIFIIVLQIDLSLINDNKDVSFIWTGYKFHFFPILISHPNQSTLIHLQICHV